MKELIVKSKFSGKIIINSEYLEKHIINLSMKGGYRYEIFEYAWAYYKLKPWLYDIYGEYLLLYKLLRKALEGLNDNCQIGFENLSNGKELYFDSIMDDSYNNIVNIFLNEYVDW